MKSILNVFIFTFLVSLLLISAKPPEIMSSQATETLFKEAQSLLKVDSRYLDARFSSNWEIIYSFQHPDYRKAISIDEFKYFKGRIVMNYRQDKSFQRISGAPTYPSVEEMKKNPLRKPLFGLPVPPVYRLIPNMFVSIKNHKLENVFVDDSGTLGKTIIRLDILEDFPPMFQIDEKIKRDSLYVDYWEKVNGKWVLAVMRPFPNKGPRISGAQTEVPEHPVPIGLSRWKTGSFTEFKVEDL